MFDKHLTSPNIKKPITSVCYCWKRGNHVSCNYPKCPDYDPGNEKPFRDKYE